jgi:hypothetical protein
MTNLARERGKRGMAGAASPGVQARAPACRDSAPAGNIGPASHPGMGTDAWEASGLPALHAGQGSRRTNVAATLQRDCGWS